MPTPARCTTASWASRAPDSIEPPSGSQRASPLAGDRRTRRVTSSPRASSARTSAVPMRPLAPVTTTFTADRRQLGRGDLAGPLDDLVDHPVVLGLLGREPAVAVEVELDLFDGLAGVHGDALGHDALGVHDLLSVDADVGGQTLHLRGGLVHEDAGVGQREALARLPGTQEELAHRRSES